MEWMDGIQRGLNYIEANLTAPLEIEDVARQVGCSGFLFQRMFPILFGCTVGEYIRCRRLTLAGSALSATNARVIDIALQSGYDSPDSFAKAFVRFHGITPSAARLPGAALKSFAPLHIKLILEGGNMMEYKIVQKEAMQMFGQERVFTYETGMAEIPKFWCEWASNPALRQVCCGDFGVCVDDIPGGKSYHYLIAALHTPGAPVPDGFVVRDIPALTWAVFPCRGSMPNSLQSVNKQIFSEWLPNNREYEMAGGFNIEYYSEGNPQAADYYSEIWIPVKKRG